MLPDAGPAGGGRGRQPARKTISASLSNFEPFSEDHEYLSTTLIGESEILKIDQDGRVILSDAIKAHAGIADRVTFVGQGYKFQIWEPDRFVAYREEAKKPVARNTHRSGFHPPRGERQFEGGVMMAGRGTDHEGVAGGPARHIPVLLDEVMRHLAPAAGGIFIDGDLRRRRL